MSIEMLDAKKVAELIREKGWTRRHVITQLGLKQEGYKFLRGEWLPKDSARKALLLGTLARLLGVRVPQILLHLEAVRTA